MSKLHKNTIILDCDGVLLDWVNPFLKWCKDKYNYTPDPEFYPKLYNVGSWFGITTKEGLKLIDEFNASGVLLPPLYGAVEFIDKLKQNGYYIHIITCFGEHINHKLHRNANLVSVFGADAINRLTCLGMTESKIDALSEYDGSGFTYVEDHIKHAMSALQFGLKPVLVKTEQNENLQVSDKIMKVDNLHWLANLV